MLDISAASWAVLVPQWALRWAIILGVGSLPWAAARMYASNARALPAWFDVFRQSCAFFACAIAVWSFQLAADTYLVEAGQFQSFETKTCVLQERTGGAVNLECQDGKVYRGVATQDPLPENPRLFLLPNSGLAVYFGT